MHYVFICILRYLLILCSMIFYLYFLISNYILINLNYTCAYVYILHSLPNLWTLKKYNVQFNIITIKSYRHLRLMSTSWSSMFNSTTCWLVYRSLLRFSWIILQKAIEKWFILWCLYYCCYWNGLAFAHTSFEIVYMLTCWFFFNFRVVMRSMALLLTSQSMKNNFSSL